MTRGISNMRFENYGHKLAARARARWLPRLPEIRAAKGKLAPLAAKWGCREQAIRAALRRYGK